MEQCGLQLCAMAAVPLTGRWAGEAKKLRPNLPEHRKKAKVRLLTSSLVFRSLPDTRKRPRLKVMLQPHHLHLHPALPQASLLPAVTTHSPSTFYTGPQNVSCQWWCCTKWEGRSMHPGIPFLQLIEFPAASMKSLRENRVDKSSRLRRDLSHYMVTSS